jgi:hypothetical protein
MESLPPHQSVMNPTAVDSQASHQAVNSTLPSSATTVKVSPPVKPANSVSVSPNSSDEEMTSPGNSTSPLSGVITSNSSTSQSAGAASAATQAQIGNNAANAAAAKKNPKKKEDFSTSIFPTILYQCDSCNKSPLTGVRYRCNVCNEFDLCQDCMKAGQHDSTHTLQRIPIPHIPYFDMVKTSSAGSQTFTAYKEDPSAPTNSNSSTRTPAAATTSVGTTPQNAVPAVSSVSALTLPAPPNSAAVAASVPTMDGRPPRRSASSGKSTSSSFENSIERMDEVLARCHVGPLPDSFSSSTIASTFLELYDAGLSAMERHKKGKAHEQINARIAMALVNIPVRARRGGNFVARNVVQPIEQETVSAVMAALVAQMIVLDADKIWLNLDPSTMATNEISPNSKKKKDEGPEAQSLEKVRENVEKGFYFRKVESPVNALSVFQKHMLRIFQHPERFGAGENQGKKMCLLFQQATDELRDALGLSSVFDKDNDNGNEETTSQAASETSNGKKSSSGGNKEKQNNSTAQNANHGASFLGAAQVGSEQAIPGQSKSNGSSAITTGNGNSSSKDKPKSSTSSTTTGVKRKRDEESSVNDGPSSGDVQMHYANNQTVAMPPPPPAPKVTATVGGERMGSAFPSAVEQELRQTIKRLREEVEDAHSRIDVLVHLLREKIANPLIRGLDRAGR